MILKINFSQNHNNDLSRTKKSNFYKKVTSLLKITKSRGEIYILLDKVSLAF